MKVKNRLLNYNIVIYQDDDLFKFSLDSVLLANFVTLNLRCKKVIDLATGNAPIPMLLTNRTKAHIDGIELQECIFNLGVESVKENGFEEQISLKCGDVRNINKYFQGDVVRSAFYLLKNNGVFAMVHKTDRFIEVIECLKKYKFEPKKVQFIYPKDNTNSDLFMIEASKNGKSGVKILSGLIIHNSDGSYKENIRNFFE